MKTQLQGLAFALALTTLALSSAHATLFDRGSGMIYDSDQNITWLQDANYAQTSGYDGDGRMTWNAAMIWADSLVYEGYSDWRLPIITDIGNDGCNYSYNGTDCGFNVDTSGSELAYLWYDILGNTPWADTSGSGFQAGWGLSSTSADGVTFSNLQSSVYWSGTVYAPNATLIAWHFLTDTGGQGSIFQGTEQYAWAVSSGDIAATPEPGSLFLFASGLLGFAGVRGMQQQLR